MCLAAFSLPIRLASLLLALLFAVGVRLVPAKAAPGAADQAMEIDILVDNTTVNGNPWAGGGAFILPHIPFMPNNPTLAPSVIMCVVTLDRPEPACHGIRENGMLHPSCVQSFDCEWPDMRIPDDPFGLVFFTRGMLLSKLVDGVIFTRTHLGHEDPRRRDMDQIVRNAAARLAPPLLQSETERRERPFQVFRLEDCAGGCRLRQSKVTMMVDN